MLFIFSKIIQVQANYHLSPQVEVRRESWSDGTWRLHLELFLLCVTNHLQTGRNQSVTAEKHHQSCWKSIPPLSNTPALAPCPCSWGDTKIQLEGPGSRLWNPWAGAAGGYEHGVMLEWDGRRVLEWGWRPEFRERGWKGWAQQRTWSGQPVQLSSAAQLFWGKMGRSRESCLHPSPYRPWPPLLAVSLSLLITRSKSMYCLILTWF